MQSTRDEMFATLQKGDELKITDRKKTYDEARSACQQAVDRRSITKSDQECNPDSGSVKHLHWVHAETNGCTKVWNPTGPSPEDVDQGGLGTCYFLASIAAVAERDNGAGIEKLIVLPSGKSPDSFNKEDGPLGVLLFVNGEWQSAVIEPTFPARDNSNDPVYSRAKNGVFWPQLLEKAWVVVAGDGEYKKVEGGFPAPALHALSQLPAVDYNMSNVDDKSLWNILTSGVKRGSYMTIGSEAAPTELPGQWLISSLIPTWIANCTSDCCSCGFLCFRDCCPPWFAVMKTAWGCMLALINCVCCPLAMCCQMCQTYGTGIPKQHAYSILDAQDVPFLGCGESRLVKVRNPWGKGAEWTGIYSDKSCYWSEAAKSKVDFQDAEDGTFWMPVGDLRRHFKMLTVTHANKSWPTPSSFFVENGDKKKSWSLLLTSTGKASGDILGSICMDIPSDNVAHGVCNARSYLYITQEDSSEVLSSTPDNDIYQFIDNAVNFSPIAHRAVPQFKLDAGKNYRITMEWNDDRDAHVIMSVFLKDTTAFQLQELNGRSETLEAGAPVVPPSSKSRETKASYVKMFKMMDHDGDGNVTKEEMAAALKSLPPAELENLFNKMDTDHSGLVSIEELSKHMVAADIKDEDGDGDVDNEDLVARSQAETLEVVVDSEGVGGHASNLHAPA